VGNGETGTSQPLITLRARDGIPDWIQIGQLLDEWQPGLLVVGQPLNMDGSESEMSRLAAKFGRRLEGRSGLPVELVDERLSSFEAKQQLHEAGHSGNYRKNPVDALAAQLILQSYLIR
jgi:putative Holliday junction resolvase